MRGRPDGFQTKAPLAMASFWKQRFQGTCVPNLEIGNEGKRLLSSLFLCAFAFLREFKFSLALFLALALTARAQTNLVPNGDFQAADPLQGWRIDFPYAEPYAKNKMYVKATTENAPAPGGRCVVIQLPPGVAGSEGGKIESAFLPAEPGATYRVEIDCLTWDFAAKTFVEAWIADPQPIPQPDKFRVPADSHHPPLLTIYRAQIPDPKGGSKTWQTVSREFTLPKSRPVGGRDVPPEYLTLKAFTYAGTPNGGKSYFANFRLYKIKGPQ